jgi:hypothetical protein
MPLLEARRLAIPEVMYFRYRVFEDERGFFAELWKRTEYLAAGLPFDFVQVNLSYSRPYVVRGLHYQLKPSEQGKLVFVVRGRVFDVAVDIGRARRISASGSRRSWGPARRFGSLLASPTASRPWRRRTSCTSSRRSTTLSAIDA